MRQIPYLALVALSLLWVLAGSALGQETEQVKVMIAGVQGHLELASAWLEVDPLTDPYIVPARAQDSSWSGAEIARFVRIYFPRTYSRLIETEYMILASIEVWVFSNKQQRMLHDAIYVDGLGGMQERSVMSMHDYISKPWADSILSDAYPNDADAVVSIDYRFHDAPMRVVINSNPNIPPIFTPYKELQGVEYSFTGAYGTNLAIPKPGAIITSYSVGPYEYGYPGNYPDPGFRNPGWIPHSMFWEYGNGTTWTHQDMVGQYWNTQYNPYAPDMILAEIIFSTGRELPQDVVLVHRLRLKFTDFDSEKSYIYSILDFVDRFGANTNPVLERLGEISEIEEDSRSLYLRQEYDEASAEVDTALREIQSLRGRALELKDRALLWIYVIEWLSVTGVSLGAGFVLWTVMVRRRLYREVSATRLREI
jgi:hypothetical protein